jgi:hypothetical protein
MDRFVSPAESLLSKLARADPALAGELLEAVRRYSHAERRLIARDTETEKHLIERRRQLDRLDVARQALERELDEKPRVLATARPRRWFS